MRIKRVIARQVLDSRGWPTVECEIEGRRLGRAIVPSGASTGKFEAIELRDGGKAYLGRGVSKAVAHIHKVIGPKIVKKRFTQETLDRFLIDLDGTGNKRRLGANALLAVSMAFANAGGILFQDKGDPRLYANIINGGKHAGNTLVFQEFMLVPTFRNVERQIRAISEVYHSLGTIMEKKYGKYARLVGDEGGYAYGVARAEDALALMEKAVGRAGYSGRFTFALDAAASSFYDKRRKKYKMGRLMSVENLHEYYLSLIKTFPISSIEDPFEENDFESFARLRKASRIQIVGDDLLVTNQHRIRQAAVMKSCNALLLKVNQIGTITQAVKAALEARRHTWKVIVSHRSGESEDAFIADFARHLGADIKLGAPARGERTAKYNQLVR